MIAACPAGEWCIETPSGLSSLPLLHAVWAVDANNVFTVGDGGTILRRKDGMDWTAMASGTTVNLRSVWASSASNAWAGGPAPAAGQPATLLHFNGTAWSSIGAPMSTVDSIWGSGPNDVWFVGSTVVLHWNGASFSVGGLAGILVSVSGTAANDAWVTGENANVHRWNGTSWTKVTSSVGSSMSSVFARTFNDVWVTSLVSNKETARYDGVQWKIYKTRNVFFKSVAGQAANDIWAVGNSKVGHWTGGAAWSIEEPFGTDASLWSVATTPGHLWIVGGDSLIAHRTL